MTNLENHEADAAEQTVDAHTALNILIQQLEKAAMPDRQLDRLIEETRPGVLRHPYDFQVRDGYVISGPDHPHHQAGQGYLPPHYTGSIDDALTLVPEGNWWEVRQMCDPTSPMRHMHNSGLFTARTDKNYGAKGSRGTHDRPAIALCIAALKASAAIELDRSRSAESPPSKLGYP